MAGVGIVAGEAAFQAGTGEPWVGAAWLAGAAIISAVVAWRLWATATWRAGGLALALALFSAVQATSAWRHLRLSLAPGHVAADAVQSAVARRDADLAGAVATARRVAGLALQRVGSAAPGRAPALSDLLSGGSIEMGLQVTAGDTVVAVAGPQRVAPLEAGTTAAVVHDPFVRLLVVVEERGGRRAQVNLLMDASPALPAPGESLAERSRGWQGIEWQWNTATGATTYTTATLAAAAVRETMVPVDPDQGTLLAGQLERTRWFVIGAVAAVAVIVLGAGAPPLARAGALVIPLWVAMRSGLFLASSSGSTTTALLAGAALMLIAVVLWRRDPHRVPVGIAAAVILLALSPVLVAAAARSSAPAADGITIPGWFAWQAMLALAASGYLALASAPLRSRDDDIASWHWGGIATGASVILGLAGIELWTPSSPSGWPAWYSICWIVPFAAMVPPTRPDARRLSIFATAAIVAALAAWNTSLRQRMDLATADLERLASTSDSVTTAALDKLALEIRAGNASSLDQFYSVWRASDVAAERIPTQLAIWVDTTVIGWVALDSLAPSWGDLQGAVAEAGPAISRIPMARGEGRHTVLVVPLAGDTAATVLAGPRSRLVRPTRFGRMVEWRSNPDPPYTLESVSDFRNGPEPVFRRLGRHLRTERAMDAGGAPAVVRATVSMEPPQPFAVRATLMVLLDILLAAMLWWLIERLLGLARGRGEAAVFRRSYRRTVTAALLSFFVVPAAFFTLWSVLQLRQDVARDRGLEVARVLGELEDDPLLDEVELEDPRPVVLSQVADRVDAELAVYQRGRLVAASNPLLAELGLLAPVINPALAQSAAVDPRDLSSSIAGTNVRIGIRSASVPATTIAAALPGGEAEVAREQVNLALLLLLASLGGTLAAVVVAGAVAGALGRPIEALRQRALAIGRREAPLPLENPPAEFETVFDAISQMEVDLGESEARLEEETARTARIVAWGEMARQVAHEIKNPLTPMRLGLQHLRRLGLDGRPDLAEQSAATAERLLEEIDRLDRIARAFARYGAPPSTAAGPLEPIDPIEMAREMADLYILASSRPTVEVSGQSGMVMARTGEFQQVILNLVDNAATAGAGNVNIEFADNRLAVRDDGCGIAPDQVEGIFEPTFSTTTSGTGLGLAIVRRLVEGWGAAIHATPGLEVGAELVISFPEPGSTPMTDPA